MLAHKGNQGLCKTDEADGEGTLVDDALDGVVRLKLVRARPEPVHKQRELLLESGLLELESLVQLLCGNIHHSLEFLKELGNPVVLVLDAHTLDGKAHDIDGGEAEIASAHRGLGAELIAIDPGAAAHRGYFVHISLRVVRIPSLVLVVRGVEVEEVREKSPGAHLAGELVEVIVRIRWQVADSPLLLPDLDREDGCRAIANALICGVQNLADDATALGRDVSTVVDGAEYHLIATAGVDGVHIVDEGLHCLMDTADGLVDGVLYCALLILQSGEVTLQIIVNLHIEQMGVILASE